MRAWRGLPRDLPDFSPATTLTNSRIDVVAASGYGSSGTCARRTRIYLSMCRFRLTTTAPMRTVCRSAGSHRVGLVRCPLQSRRMARTAWGRSRRAASGVLLALPVPGGHEPSPAVNLAMIFCSGSSVRHRLLCTCHCVRGPPTSGTSANVLPNGSWYIGRLRGGRLRASGRRSIPVVTDRGCDRRRCTTTSLVRGVDAIADGSGTRRHTRASGES